MWGLAALHGEAFSEPEARNTSTGAAVAFLASQRLAIHRREGGDFFTSRWLALPGRGGRERGRFFRGVASGRRKVLRLYRRVGRSWGLVGVEPVGGGAVACGEFHLAVIDALHLVDDDALDAVELAGDDVEVEFVKHL